MTVIITYFSIQITLETNINLYSKTILSDYNYFLIQELYMPIVGSDGVSLYTLFSNRIKMGKKCVDFNELTAFLCISLNDVINAKKLGVPVIGLTKPDKLPENWMEIVYITPTLKEVNELIEADADMQNNIDELLEIAQFGV